MKKIILKTAIASLLIGCSAVALADTSYVTCYYNNDKKWEWGLNNTGDYQKITGVWKKTQNTGVSQFHVTSNWTRQSLDNVCKTTLEQKGINSKVTNIYAATSSVGSNYDIIYKESSKKETKPTQPTKKLSKLSGEWRNINSCRGDCGGSKLSYTVGVEKGKEIGKSTSLGKSLSSTLGLEAEAFGVGVTTEFSYESNSEETASIMDSFTQSKSKTIETNCNGSSELWQWISIATIKNGNRLEEIEASSALIACASSGKGPKGADRRNPAWTP